MANINTQINPTNDPNYTNTTRPISIPDSIRPQGVETNRIMPEGVKQGDRSAEYEGQAKAYASQAQGLSDKAYGDLFEGIVKVGDFLGKAGVQMVQRDIENQVYDVADAERNLYMQRLEEIKNGGNVKSLVDTGGTPDNSNAPSELQELPDQLSVLTSARNGGKISSTDYRARLLARAKDLRAKYPGFRQEIDAEFAKVTGMNPANSVITGLISDINRQASSRASETNKLLTYIMNNQGLFPDAALAAQKVQNGEWGRNEVIQVTAPHERMMNNIKEKKAVFDDVKLSDEERARTGGKLIDDFATYAVSNFVTKFTSQMGLNTDSDVDRINGLTKVGTLNSQRWQELGQLYSQGVLDLRQKLWEDARSNGLVKTLGAAEVNKRIDAAMERTNIIRDRIYAQDSGGIYNAAKTVKAMQDDDTKNAMQDPIIGAPFRLTALARNLGGDQWVANTSLAQATEGLRGKWEAYGKSMQNAIAVQQGADTSGPLTLNRVFDSYADKMKDASPKDRATIVNSTINRIKSIADSSTPEKIRENYALAAFSEGNRGFISRLNQDSYDAKGRPIRGQNAVFQDLTSPSMTKAIKELGQRNPRVWDNYVNWATETLGNELISRDARYLDQIRNPAINVGWDSDNHRFVFSYNISDEERSRLHITRLEEDAEGVHVRNIVNRLNSNISGYRNIAEAAGADVDSFVLGSIAKAVGPESLSRVGGIPANIIRDIGLTRLKKKD